MTDVVEPAHSSTAMNLEQLEAITSGHMSETLDRACQPTHPTIYCIGLHVSPKFQGRGVGTRMVEWAKDLADSKNAAAWAHLSDSLAGINTVTVDLDKYAIKDAGRLWGTYSQHCMYRGPM
jgi:GNAT superfamily N-acetyltransferase